MPSYSNLQITKISDNVTTKSRFTMNISNKGMINTVYTDHGVYEVTWKGVASTASCKNGEFYLEDIPLRELIEK